MVLLSHKKGFGEQRQRYAALAEQDKEAPLSSQ
jgi:hypothetical protein